MKRTDRPLQHISALLARHNNRLQPPQGTVERECRTVIKELIGIELSDEQVEYTVATKTLSLRVQSVLKQHIRLKQAAIEGELEKRLGRTRTPRLFL